MTVNWPVTLRTIIYGSLSFFALKSTTMNQLSSNITIDPYSVVFISDLSFPSWSPGPHLFQPCDQKPQ